nr:integrase core domain-containing protein [Terriglobus roseus]
MVHERIQPGKPQQNGRHERMHRTLKQDTTSPSAKTIRAQQKRFDEFRRVYNYERPHEALNHETPGSLYAPSTRLLPRYTKAYVYPAHFQTRRVNDAGDISWHKSRVFISEVFRGEDIGLEKVEDHFYKIYFCNLEVGEFDVNDLRFRPGLRP